MNPAEIPLGPFYEWTTQDFKTLPDQHEIILCFSPPAPALSALASSLLNMTREGRDSRDTWGTGSCAICSPSPQAYQFVFDLLKPTDQWLHSSKEGECSEGLFLSSVYHGPPKVWGPEAWTVTGKGHHTATAQTLYLLAVKVTDH